MLEALGLWDDVSPRLVQGASVREALAWVTRGEARFGLVYATDAALTPDLSIIAAAPSETHDPIVYVAALTPDAPDQAVRFAAHLSSTRAQDILQRYGFAPPPAD
jgi:molybdate transport system substrate-binding protein